MKSSAIYKNDYAVRGKLAYFRCDIKGLSDVALAAHAARNEATPLHPVNAPGTYSYMGGVAALRMLFLQSDGWEPHYCKGVEGVQNKELGLIVLFQNVDIACGAHDPCPVSSKGIAVTDMVDNPTGYLWQHMEEQARATENTEVWFFCVSSRGDEVRAELSRPREIKNGGFGTFAERIFVIQSDDQSPDPESKKDPGTKHGEDDFDVPVSKKN